MYKLLRILGTATVSSVLAVVMLQITPANADDATDPLGVGGLYIAPGVDLDDPIEMAPGSPTKTHGVPQPSTAGPDAMAAAGSCGNTYAGYAPPFKWATYRWIDCSYMGSTSTATKYYNWYIHLSSTRACGQGMGYQSSRSPYWRSLGCGASGNGTVSWGNVVDYPKYKTTSQSAPVGALTKWH